MILASSGQGDESLRHGLVTSSTPERPVQNALTDARLAG